MHDQGEQINKCSESQSDPDADLTHMAVQLVDYIGRSDFFNCVVRQLEYAVAHEFCMVLLHRADVSPRVLYDGLTSLGHKAGLNNFLTKTYHINPFFSAYKSGVQAGFHRMERLSRKYLNEDSCTAEIAGMRCDESEEIGFVTDGWPRGMQELLLAVPLDGGEVVVFSLSRKMPKSGADAPVTTWLQQAAIVLISAVRKHCEVTLGMSLQSPSILPTNTASGTEWFNALSKREIDVVNLILTGHGSKAIGLRLDIALPTVKSHRRNIYHKLGVSSQAELFALASRRVWKDIHPLG